MNELIRTRTENCNDAIQNLQDLTLRRECMDIIAYLNGARTCLFSVAILLQKIKTEKSYEKEGFDSFNDFCDEVLGYKHAMCNNLTRIAERFLIEAPDGNVDSIIVHDETDYTVSQLQEVLTLDNEKIIELDENGVISPEMTTKEIRKIVKGLKTEEAEESKEAEETEETEETEEAENEYERAKQAAIEALAIMLKNPDLGKMDKKRIQVFFDWMNK